MANKACLGFPHNGLLKAPFVTSCFQLFAYEFLQKPRQSCDCGERHLRDGKCKSCDAPAIERCLGSWAEDSSCNLPKNRNVICHQFLEHTSDTYLWFIDTDIAFEATRLEEMIAKAEELDADILACPYFLGSGEITFYTRKEMGIYQSLPLIKPGEVYDLDAAGTGMMLIHRRVLVKLREVYGNIYHMVGDARVPAAWFDYDPDGEIIASDDFTFCMRAQDQGFKIKGYVNNFMLAHWKDQPLYPQDMRIDEDRSEVSD